MKTHDQRCYEDAYEQRQRDYHTAEAVRDCTEAVDHADNEVAAGVLAVIGNRARWILATGDQDAKMSFPDFVCSHMASLIDKYVDDQAYKDVNHRGFSDGREFNNQETKP